MTISKSVTFRSLLIGATILVSPLILVAPTPASAQVTVGISIQFPPPPLPVYTQPPMPELGYVWTPGYWAYGPFGYYWVPGTWVQPPMVGVYWTPPYWAWRNGVYVFHEGYWGPRVGYYGGINYGFGYYGNGYDGGRWENGHFAYNRAANNFGSVRVRNVYEQRIAVQNRTHTSYVGRKGGLRAQPTPAQLAAERDRHIPPTTQQRRQISAAAADPAFAASRNKGRPPIPATSRPGEFTRPKTNARPIVPPQHAPPPPAAQRPAPGQTPQHPAAQQQRPATGHKAAPRAAPAQKEKKLNPGEQN